VPVVFYPLRSPALKLKDRCLYLSTRIYILLDILEEEFAFAVQTLQNAEGVMAVDSLEGRPNILVIMVAPDREKLAQLMIPVLRALGNITEDLHLLMSRGETLVPCLFGVRDVGSYIRQMLN